MDNARLLDHDRSHAPAPAHADDRDLATDDPERASSEEDGDRDEELDPAHEAPEDIAAAIARDAEHPWGDPSARRAIDVLLPLFERDLALPSGALDVAIDAASARRADAAGAPAVAAAGRICVGSKAPRPDSAEGRKVLAHEAIHIAQMTSAGRSRGADAPRGDAEAAEAEAAAGARAFAAGGRLTPPTVALAPNAMAAYGEEPEPDKCASTSSRDAALWSMAAQGDLRELLHFNIQTRDSALRDERDAARDQRENERDQRDQLREEREAIADERRVATEQSVAALERLLEVRGKLAIISSTRANAVDQVDSEVRNAPPTTSEHLEGLVRAIAAAALGFLGDAIAKSMALLRPKLAGYTTGLTNAISSYVGRGVDANYASLDPADLFPALRIAARNEDMTLEKKLEPIVAELTKTPDPVAIAEAFWSSVSDAAAGVYDAQYEATLGAYYQLVAETDEAKAPRPFNAPPPPKVADRGGEYDGVLVIHGTVLPNAVVDITGSVFEGAKRAEHFGHVRATPIGALRLPVRLELDGRLADDDFEVTLFRAVDGSIRWPSGDTTTWLARVGAGQADASRTTFAAAARRVFASIAAVRLGRKLPTDVERGGAALDQSGGLSGP